MHLANPMALLWSLLAVPIVVLYILKIRTRQAPVSTVMFWAQVFEEKQPRALWQRLRHVGSLLMQLAFLALLVGAIAEPFLASEVRNARRIALILDNSASMRATDVEPTRWDLARSEAARLVDRLGPHDEMVVIAAGPQPRVACGRTGHQGTVHDALDAIAPTDGTTRVEVAILLARRLLAPHENTEIVVVSDGCFPKSRELLSQSVVTWLRVGSGAGNVGITQFQVRRSPVDPLGYQVLVEVANFSAEILKPRLDLELDGNIVDAMPIELAPEQVWSHVFEKTSEQGGILLARLDREDALPQDNVARAVLPERKRQPVLLITAGNVFLEQVFRAHPLVDLTVAKEAPPAVPEGALVVWHQKTPASLPAGDILVIDPRSSTDAWDLGDVLEQPTVAKQNDESPLMSHVRLDNVLMPEARRLTLKQDATILAQTPEGDPLYLALQRPDGKALVLTVNLDRGDLPLRTAFPILISNALAWFGGANAELRESSSTGSITTVDLPESFQNLDAGELVLTGPGGSTREVSTAGAAATVGPLDECGIWTITRLSDKGRVDREQLSIACNLTSRAETDIRSPENVRGSDSVLRAGIGSRPIWFYLLIAAWLLIALEWYFYQRRWIS